LSTESAGTGSQPGFYQVDPSRVRIFELANLHVIKVSFQESSWPGASTSAISTPVSSTLLLDGLSVPVRPALPGAAISEGSEVK
jgi:hypothetical protein